MANIIIMGGHGNGMVVASSIEQAAEHKVIGFLNDQEDIGSLISDKYPVLGRIDDAKDFDGDDVYFYFGIFSLARKWDNVERIKKIGLPLEKYITIVDSSAVVSPFSQIGYGCYIGPCVVVGPNTKIGNFVQIFGHGFVGHDAIVDDYCFVANNASIGGTVHIKQGVYIGTNCSIREFVTVGSWGVVGMGSVVIKDVEPKVTVVGNPARQIKNSADR